ncbi:pimeloyl-ACP methyl ester carboxylesterase [Prauserella sediminis]|uniref:Pimeloyl-ACP methyl ester carboxylesterase n=1 Tax=Prauserella sediminis TaxID=577680 RepID=A0A839XZU2_9PSEU|nr:pimeloyl-ACP methyl ester carboxylesterase [Prauserella sediminis]
MYAPTLTGSGDRSHLRTPDTGLSTHVQDVYELLRWEDLSDVILVGHSYGGMVITGVADRAPERIGQMVYLDAAQPLDGEGLVDVAPLSMQYAAQTRRILDGVDVVGGTAFESQGRQTAPTLPALPENPTADEIQEWVDAHDTPFPWKAFAEKLSLRNESRVRAIRRASVNTTWSLRSEPESEAAQRRLQADSVWEVDTGHNLQLLEPQQVADILVSV